MWNSRRGFLTGRFCLGAPLFVQVRGFHAQHFVGGVEHFLVSVTAVNIWVLHTHDFSEALHLDRL